MVLRTKARPLSLVMYSLRFVARWSLPLPCRCAWRSRHCTEYPPAEHDCVHLAAGSALLCGWNRGPACSLPVCVMPLLLWHGSNKARAARRPRKSVHNTRGADPANAPCHSHAAATQTVWAPSALCLSAVTPKLCTISIMRKAAGPQHLIHRHLRRGFLIRAMSGVTVCAVIVLQFTR